MPVQFPDVDCLAFWEHHIGIAQHPLDALKVHSRMGELIKFIEGISCPKVIPRRDRLLENLTQLTVGNEDSSAVRTECGVIDHDELIHSIADKDDAALIQTRQCSRLGNAIYKPYIPCGAWRPWYAPVLGEHHTIDDVIHLPAQIGGRDQSGGVVGKVGGVFALELSACFDSHYCQTRCGEMTVVSSISATLAY